jgi:hypothetical protein
MKETEVRIMDEGFEEVVPENTKPDSADSGNTGNQKQETGNPAQGTQPGARPDFRIVQPDRDKDGNPVYLQVGAMWKNVSKNGKEFYTLRIGQLKLLVFANNR